MEKGTAERAGRLISVEESALVIIDMQEKLLAVMDRKEEALANNVSSRALWGCRSS